jgi:hypothetical protein
MNRGLFGQVCKNRVMLFKNPNLSLFFFISSKKKRVSTKIQINTKQDQLVWQFLGVVQNGWKISIGRKADCKDITDELLLVAQLTQGYN